MTFAELSDFLPPPASPDLEQIYTTKFTQPHLLHQVSLNSLAASKADIISGISLGHI